jgi:hypothetical protein
MKGLDLGCKSAAEKLEEETDIILVPPPQKKGLVRDNRQSGRPSHDDKREIATCAICLDHLPVVQLLKKCWHPSACASCLRQHYFDYTLPSVTKYPVQCFYPNCESLLREHQLQVLAPSERDLDVYYRNSVLAKAYQSTRRTVVNCPTCQHPRQFTASRQPSEHIIKCKGCQSTYYCVTDGKSLDAIVLDSETLQAAELMGCYEGTGVRDGWGLCPQCNLLLSGGDLVDDDEVECACGSMILWEDAKKRVTRITQHVRQYT